MPATDQFRYNPKAMHVVFAVSCLAVFLATCAMMWKDHKDDWRGYRLTAFELDAAKAAVEKAQLMSGDYKATQEELKAAVEAAEAELAERQSEMDDLTAAHKGEAFIAGKLSKRLKSESADRDVAKANRDLGVRDALSADEMKVLATAFIAKKEIRDSTELELQDAEAALAVTKGRIKQITEARDAAKDALKKANADIERIDKTVSQIDPTGLQKFKPVSYTHLTLPTKRIV